MVCRRANPWLLRTGLIPAALRFSRRAGEFSVASRRRLCVIKAFERAALYFSTEDALNGAHHGFIFSSYEGKSVPGLGGSAGTADAVRIGIDCVGDVVVNNMRDARNINTPCRDVGRNQDLERSVTESVESGLTPVLRQVALQRSGLVPSLFQLLRYALGTMLGARKDQDRPCVGVAQEFQKQCGLEMLPDWIERVRHCVYRRGMTDLDRDRIMQDVMGQSSDVIGHGG